MRYFSAETAGKKRSDYYREWVIANQWIVPFSGDRMPYKNSRASSLEYVFRPFARTPIKKNCRPALQYSKVAAILELVQTNEKID